MSQFRATSQSACAPSTMQQSGASAISQSKGITTRRTVQDMLREQDEPIPKFQGITDQYVTLDTYIKAPDSRIASGEYKWTFMVNGSTSADTIGISGIGHVIEIQIGSFNMPILPEIQYVLQSPTAANQLILTRNNTSTGAPTLMPADGIRGQYAESHILAGETTVYPWLDNPYTQTPYGNNEFTIQIREVGSQAHNGMLGARHHFDFIMTPTATGIVATPKPGSKWDTYIFTKPLNSLDGITLVFRNPDNAIKFEPDCYYNAPISFDSSGNVQFGVVGHNLNAGDRIFVVGLASGSNVLNTYVNRIEGHAAGGDPAAPLGPREKIVGDLFWSDPAINVSNLTLDLSRSFSVTIYVAKRRMRIPLRIRGLVDHTTNFTRP